MIHNRRPFRILTTTRLLFSLTIALSAASLAAEDRPNILFCMADDWGWPHAGAYSDKVVKTPVFDGLAESGILFEHAFVSSPSCTPSRNAVITGQQFYRLEAGANLWSTLDVHHPNFVHLLRDSGYKIAHHRKAWGPGDYERGGYTEHPCGPWQAFDEFLAEREANEPFMFWLGTSDPHRVYDTGSGVKSGIDPTEIELPSFYPEHLDVRSDLADYYYEVQRWDRYVGNALQLLEQAGELENTIVIMTGDHGMPFPRAKGHLYDIGSRVPLVISWPEGIAPNRRITDFVSLTDIAPTLLEVAGIETPQAMTGQSLVDYFDSEHTKTRDWVIFGRERHTPSQTKPSMAGYPSRAIRTDDWLLILNLEPERWPAGVPSGSTHPIGSFPDCDNGPTKSVIAGMQDSEYYALCFGKRGPIELYDVRNDPDQIKNLAELPEYAPTVEQLTEQLSAYLAETDDPRFTDKPVNFESYPYR